MKRFLLSAITLALLTIPLAGAAAALQMAPDNPKIVWDGDAVAGGDGWASPHGSRVSLKVQDKESHNGKNALEFHSEGSGWAGCGWNWHSWMPADSGDDISADTALVFWMKITGDKKPQQLLVNLNCSSSKEATGSVDILAGHPDLADGAWHQVSVPMKDLYKDHADFDPKTAWEMDLSVPAQADCNFSVFVDEIGFATAADGAR